MKVGDGMQLVIERVKTQYVSIVKEIYGDSLRQVILYGSYARGDYNNDSDIDIMILVDEEDEKINAYRMQLSDKTFDFNFENDIQVMPIVKNINHFQKWLRAYPFYFNVKKEGVNLYVA